MEVGGAGVEAGGGDEPGEGTGDAGEVGDEPRVDEEVLVFCVVEEIGGDLPLVAGAAGLLLDAERGGGVERHAGC